MSSVECYLWGQDNVITARCQCIKMVPILCTNVSFHILQGTQTHGWVGSAYVFCLVNTVCVIQWIWGSSDEEYAFHFSTALILIFKNYLKSSWMLLSLLPYIVRFFLLNRTSFVITLGLLPGLLICRSAVWCTSLLSSSILWSLRPPRSRAVLQSCCPRADPRDIFIRGPLVDTYGTHSFTCFYRSWWKEHKVVLLSSWCGTLLGALQKIDGSWC